ncbi:MAG: proline--tRNA ligase [Parcubacteria group bacterium]|nr:proline--tRNA ligase [Parcubacteria group bacterium]
MKEHLDFQPVKDHAELVSKSVYAVVKDSEVLVGKIDPQYMNGSALSDHYDVNLEDGANCIVVKGKRGEERMMAAVLVPVGYRADLNGLVCEKLNAKKVSMAPLEEVIQETGMEYGSITPVGLPESWKVLIDSRLMQKEKIIVGGGKQVSKLLVPTAFLKTQSNVEVVEGLANPAV